MPTPLVFLHPYLLMSSNSFHAHIFWDALLCAVVGELKPADQLVNPEASVAAAAPAGGNQAALPLGSKSSNCGLPKSCLPDTFAVHLYSGKENVEGPRICIDGH